MNKARVNATEDSGIRRRDRRRLRILVAVADEELHLAVRKSLEPHGVTVISADNGALAAAAFAEHAPALILLDSDLPTLDGLATCAQIRRLPMGDSVPILLLTNDGDAATVEKSFAAGATDVMQKPVNWPVLKRRIRYILSARSDFQKLRQSEAANEALLNAMPDTFIVLSDEDRVVEYLPGGLQHALPDPGPDPIHLDDYFPTRVAHVWRISREAVWRVNRIQRVEFALENNTDGIYHYEARFVPYVDGKTLVSVSEITERKEAEQQIHRLAYYDSLTGLPNRQFFLERLERMIEQAKLVDGQIAILYVDLDNFKRINDTLGHTFGDGVLQAIAKRLTGCIRSSLSESTDRYGPMGIARLGGDEFIAAIEGVERPETIQSVAERIRDRLREPVAYLGHEFVVTPSIGIASYPDDGQDVEDLMEHADMAMFQAKGAGRDSVRFYSGTMSVRSLHRLQLETDLRQAVANDDLELYYQPKIDLTTGKLSGAEALLRWQQADGKFIPPDRFIPVAEESGLILQIGDRVLQKACQQAHAWQNRFGKNLCVAVNISSQQFAQGNLRNTVMKALFEAALKPNLLQLELTESILMRDVADTINTLDYLKDIGVTLAVDDFGTGYSSLSYLKRFPLDLLKIDKAFVHEMTAGGDDAAICAAIIAMARQLGLEVIAEGVETPQQVDLLREQGCHQAQGYLFGKPAPAHEFEARFLADSADIIDIKSAG